MSKISELIPILWETTFLKFTLPVAYRSINISGMSMITDCDRYNFNHCDKYEK